jgi:nucleotide-binding universal stress UspA family protein
MSFRHVIVPLDGSRLAEAAIPPAVYLARHLGCQLTLFHAIEEAAPDSVHGERHLRSADQAQRYLRHVRERQMPADVGVALHVHADPVKDVALSIVEHAVELGNDLICMCTHGRGGLRGWLYGRIPAQILAVGSQPVLLVQPKEGLQTDNFECHHLLVPLDGDPEHEAGLRLAFEMAFPCAASMDLLTVVHTRGELPGARGASAMLMPRAANALLDLAVEKAYAYLGHHVHGLEEKGVRASARVLRGDPADAIVKAAAESGADVIVMGSHGRKGMDAFWAGSVAPRISGQSKCPLLITPITDAAAQ